MSSTTRQPYSSRKPSLRIIGKTAPPIGGVTIHTRRLYEWLSLNPQLDVYLSSFNLNPTLEKASKNSIEFVRSFPLWMISRLILGFREDIVHYQGANVFGLIFLVVVKMLHCNRFKLAWSRHGELAMPAIKSYPRWKRALVGWAFKKVDFVFSANPNVAQQVREYGMPTVVLPAFLPPLPTLSAEVVDYSFIEDFRGRGKLLVAGAYKVAFEHTGRDIYGLDCLHEAFARLGSKEIRLMILVPNLDDEGRDYLAKLRSQLPAETANRVKIVNREDIEGWEVIGRADIFVRATITDGDAISVREAVSQGICVVASDCSPRPEGVHLFRSSDSSDLARVLTEQLNSERVGKASPRKFEGHAVDPFVERYLALGHVKART